MKFLSYSCRSSISSFSVYCIAGYKVLAFTIALPITLFYLAVRTSPYEADDSDAPNELDEMASATAKLFKLSRKNYR